MATFDDFDNGVPPELAPQQENGNNSYAELDAEEFDAPPAAVPAAAPTGLRSEPALGDDFVSDGPVLPDPKDMEEESILLREWRRKKALELEEKARISREKHAEIIDSAKAETKKFYEKQKQTVAENKVTNREREKAFLSQLESLNAKKGGNTWESVTQFINFESATVKKDSKKPKPGEPQRTSALLNSAKPGKHTDMTRMRQVLLKLKRTPPVKAS